MAPQTSPVLHANWSYSQWEMSTATLPISIEKKTIHTFIKFQHAEIEFHPKLHISFDWAHQFQQKFSISSKLGKIQLNFSHSSTETKIQQSNRLRIFFQIGRKIDFSQFQCWKAIETITQMKRLQSAQYLEWSRCLLISASEYNNGPYMIFKVFMQICLKIEFRLKLVPFSIRNVRWSLRTCNMIMNNNHTIHKILLTLFIIYITCLVLFLLRWPMNQLPIMPAMVKTNKVLKEKERNKRAQNQSVPFAYVL